MDALQQTHVAFHLTGRAFAPDLEPAGSLDLHPALLAPYRDLRSLRYGFPLVLADENGLEDCVQPLSAVIDNLVRRISSEGTDAELASTAWRLEREIRSAVAGGERGRLAGFWEAATRDRFPRLAAKLPIDGDVIDCDADAPRAIVSHAWRILFEAKGRAFRERVTDLVVRLSEILRADFARSEPGRTPGRLRASVGGPFEDEFDFATLSEVIGSHEALSPARLRRINWLIETLGDPWMYRSADAFVFDTCAGALAAYRERATALAVLSNALAIADLEVRGEYLDSHDALFATGDDGEPRLDEEHAAQFPEYLVCLNLSTMSPAELSMLMEMLALRLPMKVLLQTDDLLEDSALLDGRFALDLRARQVAQMAMALGDVFVLQAPASHLQPVAPALINGLRCGGPAVFSVFSGGDGASDLAPYLIAAAALESRAFPIVVFDPAAGESCAARLSLAGNPQSDLDWPIQTLAYADERFQEIREITAFTAADFIACDARHAHHFARVPRRSWSDQLMPVTDALDVARLRDRVPALTMVDATHGVHKLIVDEPVLRETRRCRAMWRSLQEMAGGGARLPNEIAAGSARGRREDSESASAGATADGGGAPSALIKDDPSGADDPYIETPRCSTCNECTRINNRLFAYNADRQAYIADATAGTFAQLVEAAESCQLSIIPPGKPKNPGEPGLEELIARAAAFQ